MQTSTNELDTTQIETKRLENYLSKEITNNADTTSQLKPNAFRKNEKFCIRPCQTE